MATADTKRLTDMAARIRRQAIEMAYQAGNHGAHLGGSLSCVEIFAVLYGKILNYQAINPAWEGRDRLIVGKEHGRLSEYPAMVEAGILQKEDLDTCLQNNGKLAGHPRNLSCGLEYSSCSLGMALPVAVGMALAAKRSGKTHKIYTIMGDGELDEGSMWEAFLCAAHYKLDNLVAIVDRNGLSSDGNTEEVMTLGNLKAKLEAFDWRCIEVADGHDIAQLENAFESIEGFSGKPSIIIANTIKGKGVSYAENSWEWHRNVLTEALYKQALLELEE